VAPTIVASPRSLRGSTTRGAPSALQPGPGPWRSGGFGSAPRTLRLGYGRAGCAAACSRAGPPRDGGSHSSGGWR